MYQITKKPNQLTMTSCKSFAISTNFFKCEIFRINYYNFFAVIIVELFRSNVFMHGQESHLIVRCSNLAMHAPQIFIYYHLATS